MWTGSTSNDSTTVRKDQSFELVLTEYKGKVWGYSRSEFIVNDSLFYIVKKVKGNIEGDTCRVTDDDIVAHNFPHKPDKGVKVTSTFFRNSNDSVWHLDGKWKTNKTKNYYAITGKVGLSVEKDLTASKIFPHLEELNLANDIAFYRERTIQPSVVKVVKPERRNTSFTPISLETNANIITVNPNLPVTETYYSESVTKTDSKIPATKTIDIKSAPVSITVSKPDFPPAETFYTESVTATTTTVKANTTKINIESTNRPEPVKPNLPTTEIYNNQSVAVTKTVNTSSKTSIPVSSTNQPVLKQPALPTPKTVAPKPDEEHTYTEDIPTVVKTKPAVAITSTTANKIENPSSTPPVAVTKKITTPAKTTAEITASADVVSGRKSSFTQEVNFASDSLIIALYDNGEIDGDTVSVFINGEMLMAKQGLKSSAIKKTIYITPGKEDFSLVLFADNLGKYPPNTGLLVVYDGEDTYNLRFSSDFQKNAGIVFKRKR